MFRLQNLIQSTVRKFWKEIFVIALYLILTVIVLYPFSVLNVGTELIGDGGDGYQSLWNLWWVKRSTLSFTNPYVTDYLYYPYGADLYVHSLSPAAGFLTIPFQLTLGLVFSYNLIVILSFVLGGYGAYRLAYHITSDRKASFFGGLVFAFSAYHFARALEHMNLVSIQWMPFYLLFLLKMRQEKSFKNAFFAATFLILTGLTADLQYVLFLGLFTVFFVMYEFVSNKKQFGRFLVRLGILTGFSAGLMVFLLAPMISGFFTGKYDYAVSSPSDSVTLSADLLAFFTPNSHNLFFGSYTAGVISNFSSSPLFPIEGVTYIGYTVSALIAYATIKLRKTVKFWLFSSLGFTILSLGPMLHVMGFSSFTIFHVNIPLPELVLYYAFPIFRVPARIIVMATLCLAVVSAITLKHANGRIGRLKNVRFVCLLLLAIISTALIAESNMLPYPVVDDTSVPQFYYELAKMNSTFSVLDLPQTYQANNLYMYYGTVSEKPLVGGSISRMSPQNFQLLQAIPVIRQMTNVLSREALTKPTDIIQQNINLTNINAFQFFNVKYVILHKDLMDNVTFKTTDAYLNSLLGTSVYVDERIAAYETNAKMLNSVFTFLTDGWWDLEERNGTPIRWMGSNGTIQVNSPSTQYCTANFTIGTDNVETTLKVFLNGKWLGDIQTSARTTETILTRGIFRKGINELSFSSNQSYVPSEVNATSSDTRRLSVYMQNVEILPD